MSLHVGFFLQTQDFSFTMFAVRFQIFKRRCKGFPIQYHLIARAEFAAGDAFVFQLSLFIWVVTSGSTTRVFVDN